MFLTVIAVTTLLSGCSFGTIEEQKTGDVTYEIVKKEEIPEQLKEEIKEETLQEALERTLEKYPPHRHARETSHAGKLHHCAHIEWTPNGAADRRDPFAYRGVAIYAVPSSLPDRPSRKCTTQRPR